MEGLFNDFWVLDTGALLSSLLFVFFSYLSFLFSYIFLSFLSLVLLHDVQ